MTVYLVISLPKIPYIHCIYMVLANPTHVPNLHPIQGMTFVSFVCSLRWIVHEAWLTYTPGRLR